MTLPSAALSSWLAATTRAPLPVEQVSLLEAVGRVLAADVCSRLDSPVCAVAAMDGVAVTAGTGPRLGSDAFDVVDTGDPLPPGRDAVVVKEQVTSDGPGIRLPGPVVAGRHVRPRGEDVSAGDLLLHAGTRLRPVDVALAAAGGHPSLPVRRRPRVVVVPTGDEVVPPGSTPQPGQVLDSNSVMLVSQALEAGADAHAVEVVPDDPGLLAEAVRSAVAAADLVVVGAGSSAGRDDHTAAVLRGLGTVVVHGLSLRPGHPVVLAVVDGTPVLGSPGYPVSAALVFDLLAAPLLAELLGSPVPGRPTMTVPLGQDVVSPPAVEEWLRVRLVDGEAVPVRAGAGGLASLAHADGLLLVPGGSAGATAGDLVEIELLHARNVRW